MIRSRTLDPLSTLGLGIVCMTCLLLLVATGLSLLLYYVPHQDHAYERILHIMTALRYGKVIRNLHYLAANVLLIAGILHLARVFFTGSYKDRWLNWIYGLFLLALTFLSNYTGYLLPWDQTSYWAIKVGSNQATYFPWVGPSIKNFILGGEEIGPETLIRCFGLHVAALPFLWATLTSLHLWRIRKDGGLAAPEEEKASRLPSSPLLFRAELTVAFLTLALLFSLSLFIGAPLSDRADALHPPNPAKAPWYFVGIQEMLSHSSTLGGVVIPALIGLFLVMSPLIDRSKEPGGKWFGKGRLTLNTIFALIFLGQLFMIIIGQWFRTTNWVFKFPW